MPIKLSWFKLMWLNSDERRVLREAQEKVGYAEPTEKKVEDTTNRPYKNIIYTNGNITVIFWSGAVISKQGVNNVTFQLVKSARTEAEIEGILLDKPVTAIQAIETIQEKEQIRDNLFVFRDNPDFEINEGEVFLKPAKLPLPAIVAATFIEILERRELQVNKATNKGLYYGSEWQELDDAYKSLKSFWLLLALNPLEQSREDTLVFVKKNDVRLTKNGNMVLYRRIIKQGSENKDLVKFISQEYFRVKKWKKSPKNYNVYNDGGYIIVDSNKQNHGYNNYVGNLGDLYANLENMVENTYTSWHNNGDLTIKIGGLYRIDEKDINLNNGLCAAGGLKYVASF